MLSAFSSSLNTLFFHFTPMNSDVTSQTTPSYTAEDNFSGELVECEWEAAEALACLSHPVAEDHTAGEIELCLDAGAAHISEQGIAIKSQDEQEVDESELNTSFVFDLNYPPVMSRKSRHELTEAKKEERRLRRVLANRESAKRTVRRRQAMRERLRRKAVDLSLENEKLKKNKELAATEYNSLKIKNDNLRMQIAKIVKAEVEETYDDSKSTLMEAPTSTTSQTFLHNQVPLVLSTVFPNFDGLILQSGPQSSSCVAPQMPNTSFGGFKPSVKVESSVMMNTPGTPLYIVSFPCQMQFHAQSYPFHPYPNDQHTTSLVHECSTSTPKTMVNMENHLKATMKVETRTPDTKPKDFLHDADRACTSSPFVLPVIARQNEITQQHIYTSDVKVICSSVGCVACELAEVHQKHVTFSNNVFAEANGKWNALMK